MSVNTPALVVPASLVAFRRRGGGGGGGSDETSDLAVNSGTLADFTEVAGR